MIITRNIEYCMPESNPTLVTLLSKDRKVASICSFVNEMPLNELLNTLNADICTLDYIRTHVPQGQIENEDIILHVENDSRSCKHETTLCVPFCVRSKYEHYIC